jgi:regulatory protein
MRKTARPVKIPSAQRLANIALHYLSRYAASEGSLRRVLQNRIRRAAMRDAVFCQDTDKQNQLRLDIETIIEKHRKTGALNDVAYAEVKTNSLRRSGKSRRAIEQKLQLKGISKPIIANALQGEDEDQEVLEMKAAITLAKKRRLGNFRVGTTDPDRHKKDIAVMARAGFSLNVIRKVLGGDFDGIDEF